MRAEQSRRTEREREREGGVCTLNRADAHRERERCVHALESKTSRLRGSTGDSQKLGLGAFLKGKMSLKGSAMLLSCNTVHLHFSNYGLGHESNRKYGCVNRALKN